ncbi:nuclear transport factor 2 family protein [Sinomicrobium sp. M5D2P17]
MTEKEKFLRKFNQAFVESDTGYLVDNITENIIWNIPGDRYVRGKEAFIATLKEMKHQGKTEVEIEHIITHGRTAAVNGIIQSENGPSHAFCDVYMFSGFKNPKIKEITSYVIRINNRSE